MEFSMNTDRPVYEVSVNDLNQNGGVFHLIIIDPGSLDVDAVANAIRSHIEGEIPDFNESTIFKYETASTQIYPIS